MDIRESLTPITPCALLLSYELHGYILRIAHVKLITLYGAGTNMTNELISGNSQTKQANKNTQKPKDSPPLATGKHRLPLP